MALPSRNGVHSASKFVQSTSISFPLALNRGGGIERPFTLMGCQRAALLYRAVNRFRSASVVYLPRCWRTAVTPLKPNVVGKLDVDGSIKFQTFSFRGMFASVLPLICKTT